MKEQRTEKILSILESHSGIPISGEEIAKELGISRAAVCKMIAKLRREGFRIEAKTRSGYIYSGESSAFTARSVTRLLNNPDDISLSVTESVDSTNNALKIEAEAGAREGRVLIAKTQTAGKGRRSHSFFSPKSGLYMSVLLRPKISASDSLLITTAAAVAVAKAIRNVSGKEAGIKWVNDIYLGGKKVCGILTEASIDFESGTLGWAVLGIGVNLLAPEGGFPAEIAQTAGAVFEADEYAEEKKSLLAAEIINVFFEIYRMLPQKDFMEDYRARNILLGKEVNVIRLDQIVGRGTVVGIDSDARLILRLPNGEETALSSGEVSVRGL